MTTTPPEYTYDKKKQISVLSMNTLAFTVNFAVWTMFSVIGIKIKGELGLSETEFGLLIATPYSYRFFGAFTPWLPDRPVWRTHRLFYSNAAGCRCNLWLALCRSILAIPCHWPVYRFGRWFICHWYRLHLGLVREKRSRVLRWVYLVPAMPVQP